MPKFSAVISLGDRRWHSIRETKASALYRVSVHMMLDADDNVATMGQKLKWRVLFDNPYKQMLEEAGFKVEIKEI